MHNVTGVKRGPGGRLECGECGESVQLPAASWVEPFNDFLAEHASPAHGRSSGRAGG